MTVNVSLPEAGGRAVARRGDRWESERLVERMWSKDPTVWSDPPGPEIADRLGWLDAPTSSRALVPSITALHDQAVQAGITDIVLCGMGGSSLAPEVLAATLPMEPSSPRLTVIDSTHPGAVTAAATETSPATTWYVIASKSGGTIETMSLFRFFWQQAAESVPDPGRHFIAITDPGTSLEALAEERGFRATFRADPNVGGRYSALTAFGLVPTGLIGGDVDRLLDSAQAAAQACGVDTPLHQNPGFGVGVTLAEAALAGTDKAQFLCDDPLGTLGIWIEQLIAESTGKEGCGIVPIDGGQTLTNRSDTIEVRIGDSTATNGDVNVTVDNPFDVAGVMFILEFATAVAGVVLGINPFDQPDVQLAKKLAASAMEGGLRSGAPVPVPVSDNAWVIELGNALTGDAVSYVAIQAYIPQTASSTEHLDELRRVLSTLGGAHTTVGFGPRFLHSTGQLHKGGPNGGVYLQIVDATREPLPIPETDFSFNELITAQAAGDRAALVDRDRAVIAVDLGEDTEAGLTTLLERLSEAFGNGP